jgi:tRNA threonylcarbamoyl adenosine modification protein YjeE
LRFFVSCGVSASRLGGFLSRSVLPGTLIVLQGPVGAGKTEIARGLIQHLTSAATRVPSPSFVLHYSYPIPATSRLIHHIDLYRLKGEDDKIGLLEVLRVKESLANGDVCVMEWADGVDLTEEMAHAKRVLRVEIGFESDLADTRQITIHAHTRAES